MSVDDINTDLPAAGSEPVATDLNTIISEAITKTEAGASDEGAANEGGRSRDQHGRFAATNSAPDASQGGATDGAQTAETDDGSKPATAQPLEAPARWSEADKAKFAALPREAQEIVVDRSKAMEADYTRKTQEVAEYRKLADPLLQAVQPFEQYHRELSPVLGLSQAEMIQGLLKTEVVLRRGTPEQKAAAFHDIATTYGIDLAAFSQGGTGEPSPLINELQKQVHSLTSRLSTYEHQNQQEFSRQLNSEVETFKASKNADGTPAYPHFERFKGVMAQLLQTGEADTLDAAYQIATEPLKAALAEELQTRQKSADTQRQDTIAKAKKAAPITSSGSQPGGGAAAGQGLDDIIRAASAKAGIS